MPHQEIIDRAEFARLIRAEKCLRVFLWPEIGYDERVDGDTGAVMAKLPAKGALAQLAEGAYDCLVWRTLTGGAPYISNDPAGLSTRIERQIETSAMRAAKARIIAAKLERSSNVTGRAAFDRQMRIVAECEARIATLRARIAASATSSPNKSVAAVEVTR